MRKPKEILSLILRLAVIGGIFWTSSEFLNASAKHPTYQDVMKTIEAGQPAWERVKLQDSDAREFSLDRFRGKLLLISFFFTSCPDICPPQTAGLAKTWDKLSKDARDSIAFVSISLDSRNDTPARLSDYKKRFRITTDDWTFARGTEETVRLLGNHFGSLGKGKDPKEHRGRIYLLDPNGMYLLSFASTPVIDSDHLSRELTAAAETFVKARRHVSDR